MRSIQVCAHFPHGTGITTVLDQKLWLHALNTCKLNKRELNNMYRRGMMVVEV
jgi:hypothetical protein